MTNASERSTADLATKRHDKRVWKSWPYSKGQVVTSPSINVDMGLGRDEETKHGGLDVWPFSDAICELGRFALVVCLNVVWRIIPVAVLCLYLS